MVYSFTHLHQNENCLANVNYFFRSINGIVDRWNEGTKWVGIRLEKPRL
jgi:hypothetical protein